MTEAEYIEATDREKLRVAYNVLRDISGGYGPISSEWLADILARIDKVLKEAEARKLVKGQLLRPSEKKK